jgi:hypothetical protein
MERCFRIHVHTLITEEICSVTSRVHEHSQLSCVAKKREGMPRLGQICRAHDES